MPRYDYECESCHHEFELRQGFDSEPVANCPNCKGGVARRQFRSVTVMFKGSGWYVNDYGKRTGHGGSPSETKDSDGQASEPKSDSEVKATSETKTAPEAKAEPKAESKTESKDKPAKTSKSD